MLLFIEFIFFKVFPAATALSLIAFHLFLHKMLVLGKVAWTIVIAIATIAIIIWFWLTHLISYIFVSFAVIGDKVIFLPKRFSYRMARHFVKSFVFSSHNEFLSFFSVKQPIYWLHSCWIQPCRFAKWIIINLLRLTVSIFSISFSR